MPIKTPEKLYTNDIGSDVIPIDNSKSLRIPFRWSITIQAVVLTSALVQNGSKTSINKNLLVRFETFISR